MNSKKIIIAIDGYSSCGKSTIAKSLANQLSYAFIDTGAMYRALTLYMQRHGIVASDVESVKTAIDNLDIKFVFNPEKGKSDTYLNGENVEDAIRTMEVSNGVSHFAAIKEVRLAMVAQQQKMGQDKGVILDGRDIGTVVFPNAELKIFMTADPDVRAKRRHLELTAKGENHSLNAIKENLMERDHIDTTREESPLLQAPDALVLDNSLLNMQQQLEIVLAWAKKAIES